MSAIHERFIFNQAQPPASAELDQPEIVNVTYSPCPPPSRFRRKKGYTGPTAQPFNKNFKTMPKDF